MLKKSRPLFLICIMFCLIIFFAGCQGEPAKQPKDDKNKDELITLTLFYPYDTGTDAAITKITIEEELALNEKPLDKVVTYLKNPPLTKDGLKPLKVMGSDAEILNVEMVEKNLVKVNVNRQFVTQMNVGASFEAAVIKSFAKTISEFYHADGILLRVENQPYESGHLVFSADEVIK